MCRPMRSDLDLGRLREAPVNIIRRTLLAWGTTLSALTVMPAVSRANTFDEALDAAFAAGPPAIGGGIVTREGLIWSGVRGKTHPAYALGWMVQPAAPLGAFARAGDMLGHEGSNTLWHATAVVAPGAGLGVFAFTNDGPGGKGPIAGSLLARRLAALTA